LKNILKIMDNVNSVNFIKFLVIILKLTIISDWVFRIFRIG